MQSHHTVFPMNLPDKTTIAGMVTCLFICMLATFATAQVTAPGQPAYGPGGTGYAHAAVDSMFFGSDITDIYWLFEPSAPKPDSVPVIVLFHGNNQSPDSTKVTIGHMGLIRHLVRTGYTVIYPLYQYGGNTLPYNPMLNNTANVVNLALTELTNGNHVEPKRHGDGRMMIALIGHSRGGRMSFDLANNYQSLGLPKFDAMASFMGSAGYLSMDGIPTDTRVLLVRAEHDAYVDVTLESMEAAWDSLDHIPCTHKSYLQVNSDSLGMPVLTADHFFFFSNLQPPSITNTLDFYGSWRLATALFNCTFFGNDCDHWHDDLDSISYMGRWSNSTPVAPVTILDSCPQTTAIPVLLDKPAGIKIYPNPFENILYISNRSNEAPEQPVFTLLNLAGRKVLEKRIATGRIPLPADLPEGVYIYRLSDGDAVIQSGKLVKF